jgi:hypothetical protein
VDDDNCDSSSGLTSVTAVVFAFVLERGEDRGGGGSGAVVMAFESSSCFILLMRLKVSC